MKKYNSNSSKLSTLIIAILLVLSSIDAIPVIGAMAVTQNTQQFATNQPSLGPPASINPEQSSEQSVQYSILGMTPSVSPTITPCTPAAVWTNASDYPPQSTVGIYGCGFLANALITVTVTQPNATVNTWRVSADGSGNFSTSYVLDDLVGTYYVNATDGLNIASTSFTDPSLSFSPTDGQVGTLVSVSGGGFGSDSSANLTWDNPAQTLATCSISGGSLVSPCSITIPSSTLGAHTVTATSKHHTATGTFHVDQMVLTPTIGPVGTSVTVAGSGFTFDNSKKISSFTYDGTSPSITTCVNVGLSSSGTFTCTFTVPSSSAGSHTVTATDNSNDHITASSIFVVTTPSINLSPSQGPAGVSVSVSGSGFSINTHIATITFSGGTISTQTCTSATTSGSGAFSCSFTVPSSLAGSHTVTITGSDGSFDSAQSTFTVTTPTIALSPNQGPIGGSLSVSGSGFTPNTLISSFTFNGATPSTQTCNGQITSGSGAFTCTFTVPSDSPNTYSVVATGVDGSFDSATTSFVITSYSIVFNQSNIPSSGVTWGVTVGGTDHTGTGSSITVSGLTGTQSYSYDSPIAGSTGTQYICSTGCSGSVSSTSTSESATFTVQYYLIVISLCSPTGSGWYNSGQSVSATSAGICNRSGVNGTRISSYNIDGANSVNTATIGTITVSSISMDGPHTVNFISTTQYYLTDNNPSVAVYSITSPTIPGDTGWYDSGTVVTVALNNVIVITSGSRDNLYSYSINSTMSEVTRASSGTQSFTVTMDGAHSISSTYKLQYLLTVVGGNNIGYGTASPTWDNWYDSGASTTVSSYWSWDANNGTRTAITDYLINSTTYTPTRMGSGTLTTASITFGGPHTVTFESITQCLLTDNNPADAESSITASPTSDGWYDSGTVVTVVLNNVYGANTSQRDNLLSYTQDSTTTTVSRSGTGTVTETTLDMTSVHTISASYAIQYLLTDNNPTGSELSITSSPTADSWYDSGTNVTAILNYVYGVSPTQRNNLISYTQDATTTVVTRSGMGTLTEFVVSMTGPHKISATYVIQYFLTDKDPSGSESSITASQTSDSWYDAGTSVTVVLNYVYGQGSGQRNSLLSYTQDLSTTAVSRSGSGTFTEPSISMNAAHTIGATYTTQYFLTDNNPADSESSITASQTSDDWYDSGTVVTVVLNNVKDVTSTQRNNLFSYTLDSTVTDVTRSGSGTQSFTVTMDGAHSIASTYQLQYFLTVSGGNNVQESVLSPTSDMWYDSGTSLTVSSDWVWNVVALQSRTAITNWQLDSVDQNPGRLGTGTLTTYIFTMDSAHSVSFISTTQYYLVVHGGDAITYSTLSQTGDNWYDTGTSTTVSSDWVWNTVIDQSRFAITNFDIDGVLQNPSRMGSGTLTTSIITMSTYHSVTFDSTNQYYLTVVGGDDIGYGTSSPTGDNWYDSGTSTTVSTDWTWNLVVGLRTALIDYSIDSTTYFPTRMGSGTLTTGSVTFNGPHTVQFDSVTQYLLTINGGNNVLVSVTSPTNDGWYDSGTTLTASSNGIWGRGAGTGQRVASWNIDGGTNTNVATTGTVTTSTISITAAHTINFNAVTQYQVTLDAGATSALSSITTPTIVGDNYWYDSGTAVNIVLNGVYGRVSGSGTRLSCYYINGGSCNTVLTTGTVAAFSGSLNGYEFITTSRVTQYFLTLDSGATAAFNSITAPTIPGDTGWYDGGTLVTYTGNGIFGRNGGIGTRSTSWYWDSNTPTTLLTTNTFASSGMTMNAPHTIHVTTVTQYQLTVTVSPLGTGTFTITPPTISGDNYWYDSGTSVSLSASANTGYTFGSWTIDGSQQVLGVDKIAVAMNTNHSVTTTFEQFTMNAYMSDGNFNALNSLTSVFTQCTSATCQLTATNPGTEYFVLQFTNTGSSTLSNVVFYLTIPYDSGFGGCAFVLKPNGMGQPVQVNSAPVSYTIGTCANSGQLLTIFAGSVGAGQTITVTVHLDYAFKYMNYGQPCSTGSPTYCTSTKFARSYTFLSSVGFGTTSNPSSAFAAGNPTGLSIVGQKVTAIGGFLLDTNGNPKSGLTVVLCSTSSCTPTSYLNTCIDPDTGATGQPCTYTTASDGWYFFEVPAGTYVVEVFSSGGSNLAIQTNVKVTTNQFLQLNFSKLPPSDPVITGQVTTSSGIPVSGVTVQLIGANGKVFATTTTNALGYYTFRFTQPGTYIVKIIALSGYSCSLSSCSTTVTVRQFQTSTVNFIVARTL